MRYLYFLFLFFSLTIAAQGVQYGSKVIISGKIIDSKSQRPVEFANIGFVGKGIGTVSDADGSFSISFAPALLEASDRFQISVIGYKTRIFSKNDALLAVGKPLHVSLVPEPYSLGELVLGETKRRKSTVGDLNYDERIIGYWKDIEGLGGEILTKVKIRRKNTQLENLKFNVLENGSDSLLVRVNVYDTDYGLVGQNLLKKSIKHTITTKEGLVTIPLQAHGIYVHKNIIVGIELLKVFGRQIGFSLAGSQSKGISFVRYRSQGYYKPVENTSMAFELGISVPDRKGNSIDKRSISNHITLYWDASASTDHRDIPKELQIIEELLKETKEAQVDVIKYGWDSEEKKTFFLHRGNVATLLGYLNRTKYNGVARFDKLPRPEARENASVLLVTAGQTILSEMQPDFPIPVFVITTNKDARFEELESLAVFTDGDVLDGSRESIKELRKRYTSFIEERAVKILPEAVTSGMVQYNREGELIALQGATVNVQGSYRTANTDSNGNYRILATSDEILTIDFPGMKRKQARIPSRGNVNIVLEPVIDMLDQVVVKGKNEEKIFVETPTGKRNQDAVGYKNNIIESKDIYARHTTLGQILQRQSNVEIRFDPWTRKEVYVFPRTFYSSILTPQPPIIVIDGVIYNQTDNSELPQLDTQNIKSINATSSLLATVQYGAIAAGGVITIKTKSGNVTTAKKKEKPSALATGNDYQETTLRIEDLPLSNITQHLTQTSSIEDAKEVYSSLLKARTGAGVGFYMDAFKYFYQRDPDFALAVASSIIAKAPQNVRALRTAAYAFDLAEAYKLKLKLYEHIYKIAPKDLQSYRDLAAAYLDQKEYKKSFEMYKTILANNTEGIDFSPLQETAEVELQQLLAFHKSKVNFNDLPNDLLNATFKKSRRLVFEWNDPAAQFELQFVSPENKFFTWNHTIYKTPVKVKDDIHNGMMIQEFELDDFSKGEWGINLSYLQESSLSKTAPYIKYTLYTDYATPQEKKQINIISLEEIKEKINIDQITIKSTAYEN